MHIKTRDEKEKVAQRKCRLSCANFCATFYERDIFFALNFPRLRFFGIVGNFDKILSPHKYDMKLGSELFIKKNKLLTE